MLNEFGLHPRTLNGRGVPLRLLNQHTGALADFTQARSLSVEVRDQNQELTAVVGLIDVYRTGDRSLSFDPGRNFHQAESHMAEAMDLMIKMPGASLAKVHAYTNFGLLYNDMGNLDRALSAYSEAEYIARELATREPNNPEFQNRLARTSQDEALPIFKGLGDTRNVSNVLSSEGDLSEIEGDLEAARKYWEEALEICQQTGDQYFIDVMMTPRFALLQTPPAQA